jgi:hypothetical protein
MCCAMCLQHLACQHDAVVLNRNTCAGRDSKIKYLSVSAALLVARHIIIIIIIIIIIKLPNQLNHKKNTKLSHGINAIGPARHM